MTLLPSVVKRAHISVIELFAVAGACATPIPRLLGRFVLEPIHFASRVEPGYEYLLIIPLSFPSLAFAIMLFAAGTLCWKMRLFPQDFRFPWKRVVIAFIALALIYPLGMLCMFVTAIAIGPSCGASDNPNPAPLSPFREFLVELIVPAILLVGALTTVHLSAMATYVLIQSWPERFWTWALVICFGVPLLTIVVAECISIVSPDAFRHRPVDLLSFLFVDFGGDDFMLLHLIGEPVLAGVIGHWLYRSATAEPSLSSS